MDHEKKFVLLKDLLDAIVDDCNMEGSIEHIDAVSAIDGLHNEMNRRALLERKDHGKVQEEASRD